MGGASLQSIRVVKNNQEGRSEMRTNRFLQDFTPISKAVDSGNRRLFWILLYDQSLVIHIYANRVEFIQLRELFPCTILPNNIMCDGHKMGPTLYSFQFIFFMRVDSYATMSTRQVYSVLRYSTGGGEGHD